MAMEPKIITVEPGSELEAVLGEAAKGPLLLEWGTVRFRISRDDEDIWAGYDPEAARAGMEAAAGQWRHLDTEALKEYIYRAREEGSRPPDRP